MSIPWEAGATETDAIGKLCMTSQRHIARLEEDAEVIDGQAHALTVFRVLRNGEGRSYTATTFPRDPFAGCQRFLRMACLWLTAEKDGYGVLDVLNENGDIVQDFTIADAPGFQQIKRRLHLVVDCDA